MLLWCGTRNIVVVRDSVRVRRPRQPDGHQAQPGPCSRGPAPPTPARRPVSFFSGVSGSPRPRGKIGGNYQSAAFTQLCPRRGDEGARKGGVPCKARFAPVRPIDACRCPGFLSTRRRDAADRRAPSRCSTGSSGSGRSRGRRHRLLVGDPGAVVAGLLRRRLARLGGHRVGSPRGSAGRNGLSAARQGVNCAHVGGPPPLRRVFSVRRRPAAGPRAVGPRSGCSSVPRRGQATTTPSRRWRTPAPRSRSPRPRSR